jgi:hypothetical protein
MTRAFSPARRVLARALAQFRTTFAKKTDTRETVTLEHEADGAWRVVGYVIH